MRLICLACGKAVDSGQHRLELAMRDTKYRPVFVEKGVKWLCPECGAKVEEHAVTIMEMLKGESVQLWQLVPEKRRVKIVSANVPTDGRAEGVQSRD